MTRPGGRRLGVAHPTLTLPDDWHLCLDCDPGTARPVDTAGRPVWTAAEMRAVRAPRGA